jgi:predicted nucleotidyltransferase component of viral defense system
MSFPHEDIDRFLESIRVTQNKEHFVPRLIEKDYFCTLVLEFLSAGVPELVFKGGTCLAKIHAGFYRLSEDLDFTIPIAVTSRRPERKKAVQGLKTALDTLTVRMPFFQFEVPLTGANNSTQYNATIAYNSILSGDPDIIKIEVALREPLVEPVKKEPARTLLVDPVTRQPLLPPVLLPSISFTESFAEKIRAALIRREAAIRDFFDIDYAVRKLGLQTSDERMLSMLKLKLAVPGTPAPDISTVRLAPLKEQVEAQLKPVLRQADFEEFNLSRAIDIVQKTVSNR